MVEPLSVKAKRSSEMRPEKQEETGALEVMAESLAFLSC